MAELVTAYDRLGRPAQIPSNWISHPRLGADWSLTPPAVVSEPQTPPDPAPVLVTEPAEIPHKTPHGGDKED